MYIQFRAKRSTLIVTLAAGLAALVLGAVLFAWSGLYSVAASRGHWFFVEWLLTFGMQKSVETHALRITPPPLDDDDLVRLGAAHFHSGCAFCHGAPGLPRNPVARHMLPPPPDLAVAAPHWRTEELFWIVKNGLKYTGMPSWPSQQRDDEVWAVIAFLLRLPHLDRPAYRELALGKALTPQQSGGELAAMDDLSEAVSACARCHGVGGQGPASRYVPVLHGQSAAYLHAAMEAYADGRRGSGIMQPIASDLPPEDRRRVVEYYAGLAPVPTASAEVDAEAVARGRNVAANGVRERPVPPCLPCHAGAALPIYPRLAGQSAAYIRGQLQLWKDGFSRHTAGDTIMAPIARRLSPQEIQDVSAYFAQMHAE